MRGAHLRCFVYSVQSDSEYLRFDHTKLTTQKIIKIFFNSILIASFSLGSTRSDKSKSAINCPHLCSNTEIQRFAYSRSVFRIVKIPYSEDLTLVPRLHYMEHLLLQGRR